MKVVPFDVDPRSANVYVRTRSNGRWQLVMRYKSQGRWDQATKTLPATVDTENKAKRQVQPWRESLVRAQDEARAEADREAARADMEARGATRQVADYVAEYIRDRFQGSRAVKQSTLNNYWVDEGRIRQFFGEATMSQLTPDLCQVFVNDLNLRLSPRSVRKTAAMLKRVCEEAMRRGVIASNPCDELAVPRLNRVEKNSLPVDGYRRLSETLAGMEQTPVVVAATIALRTGMREGEICALRWQDVDLAAGELRVEHNIEDAEHGTRLGETKRLASNRVIPIGAALKASLSARREAVWGRWVALGLPPERFGGVFVLGDVDGRWMRPNRVCVEWAQLSAALGLVGLAGRRVTFHDLRHTYATVAIASGADVMAVSSYLGHADPHVTLREYANADPAAKRRTADIMDAVARGE